MAQILVADDEPSIRRVLRAILERMGHQVTEAENGLVALEKYREVRPSAVLVDLYMPELDGVETMIRLKADYPDAKVVAISGGGWRARGPALEEMTALGAVDTIAKPFTADEVVETVERVLGAAPP
jgi:two-component system chemotaxis response regulator CheY